MCVFCFVLSTPHFLLELDKQAPTVSSTKFSPILKVKGSDIIATLNDEQSAQLYNLQILKEYLEKDLIAHNYTPIRAEETVKNLLQSTENLFGYHGLAWELGKSTNGLEFFFKYFLQDVFTPKPNNTARNLAPLHFEIIAELKKMIIEDKYDLEEFILPRGSAKSTVITKALTTFVHCYRISRYSLIIGKTKQDASDFIDDIKKFMGLEPIKLAFGNLINKRNRTINSQELELDNDSMIRAYGWETSVRGTSYSAPDGIFRPQLCVLDDILNEGDIKTDNAKENAINKFYKEILEVGDEAVIRKNKKIKMASKFIICGTPLAADCFINTIRKDPQFKVFRRAVVDFNIDEYFEENDHWQQFKKILFNTKIEAEERDKILKEYYYDNIDQMRFKTIWEKYDCYKLAIKYFTKRNAFLQELLCDCENVGTKWFTSMKKLPIKEILQNKFIKNILCCDPASTVTKRSDYTALCVGSLAENGFKYVKKGIIEKLTFKEYCDKVVSLFKEWPEITHCSIEYNTFKGSDVIKIKELMDNDKEFNNRTIEFINKSNTKAKDDRISTIIDDLNSGAIIFNIEDEEFNQMILDFTGQMTSLHDDAPDVVSDFFSKISEIEIHKPGTIHCIDKSAIGWNY
ncbi:MAG: hypothetical protein APF81_17720 [Desulfosporosinus sp. BRH_c37]|nr:MAG: hypothetical protein APF81_17720 [Desulfosporosinus sp. BRH_c37]